MSSWSWRDGMGRRGEGKKNRGVAAAGMGGGSALVLRLMLALYVVVVLLCAAPASAKKNSVNSDGILARNGKDFSQDTGDYVSALFSPVVLLSEINFVHVVKNAFLDEEAKKKLNGPVMIVFFDPQCPHCRHFMPHYAIAARFFYTINHDRHADNGVAMFAVDCLAQEHICDKFNVPSFPYVTYGSQNEYIGVFKAMDNPQKYVSRISVLESEMIGKVVQAGFENNGGFKLVNFLKDEFEITGDPSSELEVALSSKDADFKQGKYPILDALSVEYKKENDEESKKLLKKIDEADRWKKRDDFYRDLVQVDGNDLIKVTTEIFSHLTLPRGEQKRKDLKEWLSLLSLAHPVDTCKQGATKLLKNFDSAVWPESSEMPLESATKASSAGTVSLRNVCMGEEVSAEYRSCKGSKPYSRGYSCGLWTLFHSLTLSIPNIDQGVENPGKIVLSGIKAFVRSYFTCSECRDHFIKMTEKSADFSRARDKSQAVIWLWWAHNRVNARLAVEESEAHSGDPYFPKRLYPTIDQCRDCYKDAMFGERDAFFDHEDNSYNFSSWELRNVVRYLHNFYSGPQYGRIYKKKSSGAATETTAGGTEFLSESESITERNAKAKKKAPERNSRTMTIVVVVFLFAVLVFAFRRDDNISAKVGNKKRVI